MTSNEYTSKATTAAEEIRRLLEELHGGIVTREKVPQYRQVRRASDRTVAVLDWRTHTVQAPGLLTQLGVTHSRTENAKVEVRRWVPDPCPCNTDDRVKRRGRVKCWHGRWVIDRVEQRPVAEVMTAGAAIPSGSPGWDADGALTPLIGGTPDPGEPITDAWHTADDISHELRELGRELREAGWKPPATLVTIALEDKATGEWIVARLRALVGRARVAADYDAPAVPLRDVCCPECGGQLRVRKDASSAVWCVGKRDREGRRVGPRSMEGPALPGEPWPIPVCDATWPRGAWVALLAEREAEAQVS
ncbi:hypothetical protein [Actinomadura luteofluorescens]|uniref:hypothetical protein n=1 Tax=Actinomadura luteofluorescens TaxID=46163 RepID=UPI003D939642